MRRWVWLLAFLCAIFVVAAQQSGHTTEVQKGFAWLRAPDERLAKRGRFIALDCVVAIDGEARLLHVDAGRASLRAPGKPLQSSAFSIRGSARAWAALWAPEPLPGWHDLFALCKRGEMQIEGNLQPLMANLQWFKDVLALPRETAA